MSKQNEVVYVGNGPTMGTDDPPQSDHDNEEAIELKYPELKLS